mmetsp:Transcript_56839/g.132911  ORF Transcript_56839/g.132911 Transcript_56839/m.132911 type:complete len:136 (-) Transcript_56839:100-507(-)
MEGVPVWALGFGVQGLGFGVSGLGKAMARPAPRVLALLALAVLLRHCAESLFAVGWAGAPERAGRMWRPAAQEEAAATEEKPMSYYAGMLTNPPKEEDEEKDMVTPTLKFVGYGAVFGFAYLAVFVGLNSGTPSP